ncbi:hypothetical protein BH09BAC5_BH09BAC5_26280 [soil metagenome]
MSKKSKIVIAAGLIILFGGISFLLFKLFSHSTDAHLRLIPKNAAAVMKIDIKELAMKADPLKLLQNPAFKNVPDNGKSSVRKLIADPFSTGIDPLENVYGFLAKADEATVSAIVFKVSDNSKLEKFERGLGIDGGLEVESGIYYSEIDENRCIAWNDEAGIIMAVNNGDKKLLARKFLQQDKSKSILSNEAYKSFADKNFDLGLFLDNKELSRMSGAASTLSGLGFTDGHGELLLSFENDKISTLYNNYPDTKPTSSILKKSAPEAKHFSAVSPKTPLLYLGISADVNALFNAANSDPQMKDNIGDLENYIGMKDQELRKLFTGDISVSFTDFKDISTYDPRVSSNIDQLLKQMNGKDEDRSQFALNVPMAYVSASITDDQKMNDLIGELGLRKMGDFYAVPGLDFIVYAVAKDGNLIVTNDYYAAETISQKGKFDAKLPETISKTNPFSLWADLDQKHFPPSLTETMKGMYNEPTVDFFLRMMKPFQSIKMESKDSGSQLDIIIEPGEGNSLYRLLTYYATLTK